MASNIEIKAVVDNPQALRARVVSLAGGASQLLQQTDTFFHARQGRLKLRQFADGSAELIAYHRASQAGPKRSEYVRAAVADPSAMLQALRLSLGIRGVVVKRRELFLLGQTRVHLDQVQGLGDFMELEVVLTEGQATASGQEIAETLMRQLEIAPAALLCDAYIDLLETAPPQ